MLISDPAAEQFLPGQSRQLYAAVQGPKTLASFSAGDGSDLHCEGQSLARRDQVVFDWLDDLLLRRKG